MQVGQIGPASAHPAADIQVLDNGGGPGCSAGVAGGELTGQQWPVPASRAHEIRNRPGRRAAAAESPLDRALRAG